MLRFRPMWGLDSSAVVVTNSNGGKANYTVTVNATSRACLRLPLLSWGASNMRARSSTTA